MDRTTERYDIITAIDNDGTERHSIGIKFLDKKKAEEKLYALEDIEEELGIELITLFKELWKNSFYREVIRHLVYEVKEELTND